MIEETKKWYKTIGGSIFLAIIIIILIGGMLFLGLTGYYLWKLRFGNAEVLMSQFNNAASLQPENKLIKFDSEKYIRAYNPSLGQKDSAVTIISFIDFECPFCRQEYPIFKKVLDKYGSAIKFVFKHTPITAIHPAALDAHLAAACAGDQNKFWPYYDLLFTRQKLDSDSLANYASQLGINNQAFQNCFEGKIHLEEIEQDLKDGQEIGQRGTPTHIINGLKIEGISSEKKWDEIILKALSSKN